MWPFALLFIVGVEPTSKDLTVIMVMTFAWCLRVIPRPDRLFLFDSLREHWKGYGYIFVSI